MVPKFPSIESTLAIGAASSPLRPTNLRALAGGQTSPRKQAHKSFPRDRGYDLGFFCVRSLSPTNFARRLVRLYETSPSSASQNQSRVSAVVTTPDYSKMLKDTDISEQCRCKLEFPASPASDFHDFDRPY